MKRVFLLLSLAALLSACENTTQSSASSEKPAATASKSGEGCQCEAGKKGKAVWCAHCGAGFVGGKKITDKAAFDKAKAAGGGDKDHKCGDKADCKCGDKKDCKCGDKKDCKCGDKKD